MNISGLSSARVKGCRQSLAEPPLKQVQAPVRLRIIFLPSQDVEQSRTMWMIYRYIYVIMLLNVLTFSKI